MAGVTSIDKKFGDIAVDEKLLAPEKLDRALVIQRCILNRTKVHMPIGKVLKEMGLLTQEQVDAILETQRQGANSDGSDDQNDQQHENPVNGLKGLQITISKDKLSAHISPTGKEIHGHTLDAVKELIENRGVVFGLIDDQDLSSYLAIDPLPIEPFKIAEGLAPVPGRPPEVIYHFDMDPLRIGTLHEDGTMDWKNRGEIPQIPEGSVLLEKTEGDPGQPGQAVTGKEIQPPRIREPQIKGGKGTQRSEDGRQILAATNGTPKLGPDGRVYVYNMLPIDGDIGVDTGHIEFEGYIEASGSVTSGYSVKGGGLRTSGIEEATIELSEDLVSYGGIYGSKLKVGGNLKASHIHNCTIEVIGDLIIEKEIIQCTIETNGRCLIGDGQIIASKIDAKKGIQSKEIGTEAAKPCALTVGIDRKFERDIKMRKETLAQLEKQQSDSAGLLDEINRRLEMIGADLGKLAQEQDSFMVQKRQFEEQLQGVGPNAVKDEEESEMLNDLIAELVENSAAIDEKVKILMAEDDKVRLQLAGRQKADEELKTQLTEIEGQISILEETFKVDPGIPVIKVTGTLFAKTEICGAHSQFIIPQNMSNVRVAETESASGGKHQIKISKLR